MSTRELDKVQLGSEIASHVNSARDDDSDAESAVTEEGYNSDVVYNVDYIRYAVLLDARKTKHQGKIGWYYCIAWSGYLRHKSDNEEPREQFDDSQDPDGDIQRFWKALNRKVSPSTKEPKGRIGEKVYAAESYLVSKLKDINKDGLVRSLKRLQRRNAREAAGKVIRKKDSDYYLKYNVAQRREKLLAAHAAKSKRKRVIESDDESEGDGSGASPTTRQRAASPANSLDILDSGGSDDDDDVPLAKKRKSADTSPAQKGKDDQVEAKKRKTEAKRAARQKAEQDEEEARRAAKQAELEEVERLEKIEKKRKRKEAKERLAREAAEQERLDKEEQARLAEEKRKANEKEANWGSFTKKAKTSSPAVSSGHYSPALSHAQVPIPTPPASTSASSSRKARPAPHKSLPTPAYKLAAAHPSIQVANFGEPEPGMFDDRSAKSSNKNVSLAPALSPSHSSSGSLFAADDESLVPDVPSQPHTAPAAGTGGPLLKSALKPSPQPPATTIASSGSAQGTQADPIVLSTGDDPRRVTKSALASSASPGPDAAASFTSGKQVQFASAPAHEPPVPPGRPPSPSPPPITAVPPSPTSSRTLNSISPRSKPIVIDLERPLYSHEPKINVLEDPNIVRGRFGLGGPDSAKSAAPALPPTPVSSSNTYTPALSRPPPTGPRARPGPPQGPASAPIVRPLYAHTGPNAVPIGARPPTYTPLSAHTAMLQQGGMSPMRRSPNGYGGMSPGYQTVGPGASPHWQPNQPIPQTAAVQPVYSIAGDPRKRSRIVSGGSTPGSAHGLPPTPLASTLPIVPEDQPLQTNIQHPQRSLQASKVSSYQPRRTSVDHGAAGNPAKPVPVVPRDTWTASTSRGVIGTGRLILPIKQDEGDGTIPVRFITGSAITPATGDVSMVSLLNRELDVQIYTEPLEAFCLHGHLQRGAKIVEWAKVTYADEQSVRDWKRAKSYFDSGKIFAAYTESTSSLISRHYAIVFASGKQIDFAGLGIGLASWQRQDVDFGAFLVSLPLDSNRPPSLPNPVRPDFDIHQRKPEIPDDKPVSMLESYGIHQSLFDSLSGKPAQYRFSHVRTVLDNLQLGVHQGFSASGVRPNQGHDGRVEALISENARPLHTLRSSIIQSAALRRTTLYAVGTSLSLLPHQWKLRTIWSTGGLVTFSPTFMLRSPDKFAEVMQIIRPASNWAAYVLPVVIEYCNKSWDEPQRCPDSTNAFAALTKSLLLDEHLLRFSGSAATSGGGLAISTCPPSIHQADACTTWLAWLKLLYEQRDFEKLVELCKGVRAGDWESIRAAVTLNDKGLTGGFGSTTSGNGSSTAFDMDLIDIEKSQLEDLVNMRLRNDLVPYRRFVYIGEMSLSSASRESYSRNGIEYVKADDFAAIFSGAV